MREMNSVVCIFNLNLQAYDGNENKQNCQVNVLWFNSFCPYVQKKEKNNDLTYFQMQLSSRNV